MKKNRLILKAVGRNNRDFVQCLRDAIVFLDSGHDRAEGTICDAAQFSFTVTGNKIEGPADPERRYHALAELAEAYVHATESYDEAVCSGGKDHHGDAWPANLAERIVSNDHASAIRRSMKAVYEALDFGHRDFQHAIDLARKKRAERLARKTVDLSKSTII